MLKKTVRSLLHVIAGLSAGLAILASLVAWQLSQGPLSLGFLNDHIEDGLNRLHGRFQFQLEDTVLTWAGWERTLDVRILNVHLLSQDGQEMAYLPEVSVALNARALVRGKIAPKRIELFGPNLVLVRDAGGDFQVGFDGPSDGGALIMKGMLGQMAAEPNPAVAMSYLEGITVIDANLRFEDKVTGVAWKAPASQLKAWREDKRIHWDASLNLTAGEATAQVGLQGSVHMKTRHIDAGLTFSPLKPSLLAALSPALAELARIEVPVKGSATVSMAAASEGWTLEGVGFDLIGAAGAISLPEPMAQSLPVSAFRLSGRYEGDGRIWVFDEANVKVMPGTHLALPPTIRGADGKAHRMPLRALSFAGRYAQDAGRLEIQNFTADLDGALATAVLTADGLGEDGDVSRAVVTAEGKLGAIPAKKLAAYWPMSLGTDAWSWVTAHITDGDVAAAAKVTLKGSEKGLEATAVSGTLDLQGLTIDYLSPLAQATNARGQATFDINTMDIRIDGGDVGPLRIDGGKVRFSGLNEPLQFADIALKIDGSVADTLSYIEGEPLGFASAIGIDPKTSGGAASTDLRLVFEMDKNLTFDDVAVTAMASLTDVSLPKALLGLDMAEAKLMVKVDNKALDVTGTGTLGPMPAEFTWRRHFTDEVPERAQYHIKGQAQNIHDTRDLGFDLAPFPNEFIQGAVGVDVEYTEFVNGKADLKAKLALTDAELSLPALGWTKAAGIAGVATTNVQFLRDRIIGIPNFSVKAGDMDIAGVARYAQDGTGLQRIDLDRVIFDRNDFAGALIALDSGGWQVVAHGKEMDFAPLLDHADKGVGESGDDLKKRAADLAITVTADLDKVWIAADHSLSKVKGTVSRARENWQSIRITAEAGAAKDVAVTLEPQGEGKRLLTVSASDAGAVLRTFGFYDNLRGGNLALAGAFDDTRPGQPFAGKLQVTDYRIVNAPTIAHLVSVMALTGIVDALKGEGLSFQILDVPLTYQEGVLAMKNAKASGLSLGLTASGSVYMDADVISLEGTLVPAYAINSVFGKIPLLGDLLTGGEEGSGMFAATYVVQGALEKPKVTVNPLSALAPGFLRNLFDIFTPSAEAQPEAPAPEKSEETVPGKQKSL